MGDWQHGYASDIHHNYDYYREVYRGGWTGWPPCAACSRQRVSGFRIWAVGLGYSLRLLAAANPDYEFIGVDFAAEHIGRDRKVRG